MAGKEQKPELVDTPEPCDEKTEYGNRIEDGVEIKLEEIESEILEQEKHIAIYTPVGDIEQQFTRFERNYRARRIRELTLSPIAKKRRGRRPSKVAV